MKLYGKVYSKGAGIFFLSFVSTYRKLQKRKVVYQNEQFDANTAFYSDMLHSDFFHIGC